MTYYSFLLFLLLGLFFFLPYNSFKKENYILGGCSTLRTNYSYAQTSKQLLSKWWFVINSIDMITPLTVYTRRLLMLFCLYEITDQHTHEPSGKYYNIHSKYSVYGWIWKEEKGILYCYFSLLPSGIWLIAVFWVFAKSSNAQNAITFCSEGDDNIYLRSVCIYLSNNLLALYKRWPDVYIHWRDSLNIHSEVTSHLSLLFSQKILTVEVT
jgi:hypothetical protein